MKEKKMNNNNTESVFIVCFERKFKKKKNSQR